MGVHVCVCVCVCDCLMHTLSVRDHVHACVGSVCDCVYGEHLVMNCPPTHSTNDRV